MAVHKYPYALMNFFTWIACLFLTVTTATAEQVSHPLDALTAEEINEAVSLLHAGAFVRQDAEFANVTLDEPPKDFVLGWSSGNPIPRRAFAIVRQENNTFEALVDLSAERVLSFKKIEGVEAPVLDKEWRSARDAFMKDGRFKEALRVRGYTAADEVFCTPNPAGYFAEPRYEGRRIFRIPCFDRSKKLHPAIARPIEGLLGVVDAETLEVLDIVDGPAVPIAPVPQGYGNGLPKADRALKPIVLSAPEGPNVRVNGKLDVAWWRWNFHVRGDRRAGVILSLVKFDDGKKRRSVAYQMNVSEMFVPYMDPDPVWATRTFLDAGEFGLGYLMSPLEPGIDCPDTALFQDFTMPGDDGKPYLVTRGLCLFERVTGDPAWRHYSSGRKSVSGVQQIELVARSAATVGNYDYIIDYVFSPQGAVTMRVGATGFDAVKSVASASMADRSARLDTQYGSLIAPYTVAPFHDHYINFRIDLDVDGVKNGVLLDQFEQREISTPRKSLWTIKQSEIAQEGPVAVPHEGGNIRVTNQTSANSLKQVPSYWISSGHQAVSLLEPDDWAQKRADFSSASHWFTTYNPAERWAAGNYPNQSRVKLGLPDYVADKQSLFGADLVLWSTLGFRHVTRPEDFPILPTYWHELTLRPAFFFDMDPSMTFNPGMMEDPQ